MNKLFYSILAASALAVLPAQAAIIQFTQVHSSGENLPIAGTYSNGDTLPVSLATLEYVDNGTGGVDFTLTNTFSALDSGNTDTFISELFFGSSIGATSVTNMSSNIDAIDYSAGGFTNAALTFNYDTNLANSGGPNNLRLTDGETATWTFENYAVGDFQLPAMVHFQSLPNGGSVKITAVGGSTGGTTGGSTGGTTGGPQVPEPSTYAMFGMAFGMFAFLRYRSRKS